MAKSNELELLVECLFFRQEAFQFKVPLDCPLKPVSVLVKHFPVLLKVLLYEPGPEPVIEVFYQESLGHVCYFEKRPDTDSQLAELDLLLLLFPHYLAVNHVYDVPVNIYVVLVENRACGSKVDSAFKGSPPNPHFTLMLVDMGTVPVPIENLHSRLQRWIVLGVPVLVFHKPLPCHPVKRLEHEKVLVYNLKRGQRNVWHSSQPFCSM